MPHQRTVPTSHDLPAANDGALPGEAPARRGRGRPVCDRQARRSEILQAAISVIARDGYAGASLRKVAQEAGCTTGAVTYYFENKEAMASAIAEHLFDEYDALRVRSGPSIKTGLKLWLDWTNAESPERWIVGLQLIVHARHEPAFAEVYQRRYGAYRKALTDALVEGQSRGDVRTDVPPEILADQISAIADGWMMMFPVEPERFTPARVQALIDATITLISPAGG